MGRNKRPFYRVVVKFRTKSPTSSFIECLGFFDPFPQKGFTHKLFVLDNNRLNFWLSRGAIMSPVVFNLLSRTFAAN